jgi:hypothetical protein
MEFKDGARNQSQARESGNQGYKKTFVFRTERDVEKDADIPCTRQLADCPYFFLLTALECFA